MDYSWNWGAILAYRYALLHGLFVTFALTGGSIVCGTSLGVSLGALLAAEELFPGWAEVRVILLGIVDVIRALPILILILVLYYWLPAVTDIRTPTSIALVALSLNLAAFVADVLRGAVAGVPGGLLDAGRALGLSPRALFLRVQLPEAVRQIVPTLALLYVDILKLSSLASVISVGEVTHVASKISARTYGFLEVYAVLAVVYIAIVLLFSAMARRVERSNWLQRRG